MSSQCTELMTTWWDNPIWLNHSPPALLTSQENFIPHPNPLCWEGLECQRHLSLSSSDISSKRWMQLSCLSRMTSSFPKAEHGVVVRSGFHSGPVNFQQTQKTHHIPYLLKVWLKCITGIGQISYLHNVLIHVYRNLVTMAPLYHWYNFHSNLEDSSLPMTWVREHGYILLW